MGLIYATLGEHEAAVERFIEATNLDQYLAVACVSLSLILCPLRFIGIITVISNAGFLTSCSLDTTLLSKTLSRRYST